VPLSALAAWIERHRLRRKENWEFRWQAAKWAAIFRRPESQAKCHEYWVRFRHLDEIRTLVPMGADTSILDVGCGISTVLHFLPGRRCGVDPLADRYKTIYDYPAGLDIRRAYAETLPFPDGSFDAVFCSNCIDHTTDPAKAVGEIERVLRPGGRLVLTCEVFATDPGQRNAGHPHGLTAEKLRGLVAGFSPIAAWEEPWIGLRAYVLGEPATAQREHILLVGKPA
jgi:SAM-dependent methyltransferase